MRAVGLPRIGQELEREFFRFGIVGLSVTLLYAGGYAALRGLGAVPWAASAMAFTVAVSGSIWRNALDIPRRACRPRAARPVRRDDQRGLAVSTALTGLIGPVLGLPEW